MDRSGVVFSCEHMGKIEQSSAEKRTGVENIREYSEFQLQIGLTSIAENDVASPPEKKLRQDYVKCKNVGYNNLI